jgi:hypothetical protein
VGAGVLRHQIRAIWVYLNGYRSTIGISDAIIIQVELAGSVQSSSGTPIPYGSLKDTLAWAVSSLRVRKRRIVPRVSISERVRLGRS